LPKKLVDCRRDGVYITRHLKVTSKTDTLTPIQTEEAIMDDAVTRIEQALAAALAAGEGPGCPPRLAAAVRYAVIPGGARIRPRLCLAVAAACGEDDPALTDFTAASIELLHCASLVHDDLPCFDDAPTRRGKASVHRAFGERLAMLAGDALIVRAFQALAQGCVLLPHRLGPLLRVIGRSVGMPAGIVAGQAWECEPRVSLAEYQRAKTGALFAAATVAGALAAGAEPLPWRALGERLGEAYQVADDIRDVAGNPDELGKPVGRDAILGRPSACGELGLAGAIARLKHLVAGAIDSIPPCAGAAELRGHILHATEGLLPPELARRAA
jgi:geranylgeranyl diphosphate synthase type II